MRWIQRGPEPQELANRRKLSRDLGGTYDSLEKFPVVDALLRDQGYLCGFCMCRIEPCVRDENGAIMRDEDGRGLRRREADGVSPPWKIAHWVPQSIDPSQALRWDNMIGACRGSDARPVGAQTCDSRQGNRSLTLHPYRRVTVAAVRGQSTREGYCLLSVDPVIDADIRETLGLNVGYLPVNRSAVLDAFRRFLARQCPEHTTLRADVKRARVRAAYDEWKWEHRGEGRLRPYCGVVEVAYGLAGGG